MFEAFQNFTDDFQKMSKDGFDAAVRSYGEVSKGLQALASKVTDYSKVSLEDATRAFEQLVNAKSIEQAIEIQSQYAKKAFDTYIAELSKLGELYASVARKTGDRIGCSWAKHRHFAPSCSATGA
jgi:hypothetical protein